MHATSLTPHPIARPRPAPLTPQPPHPCIVAQILNTPASASIASTHSSGDSLEGWDQRRLRALRQEVDILANLRHPNVVMFMGVCLKPPCVVTEFCALGESWGMPWAKGAEWGASGGWAKGVTLVAFVTGAVPRYWPGVELPRAAQPTAAGSLYDCLKKANSDAVFAARLTWGRRLLIALDAGESLA